MKFSKIILGKVLLIVCLILIISCKKNSTGSNNSEPEYYDVEWVWVAEQSTYQDDKGEGTKTYRDGDGWYRGEKPTYAPHALFEVGVDYLWGTTYKCKWIHYYKNDSYIEFEEVGEDNLESVDVQGYMIEYKTYSQ